ncbi:MAG: hypothetical protein P4M00_09875 [Azospirillaceae bacterium]|nr:hypothetical protein [Azospirillaceae bacterium]
MFGLRRTGKSTCLQFIAEEMKQRDYGVIAIDAQGMRSVDKLLFDVLTALHQTHRTLLGRLQATLTDGMFPEAVKSFVRLASGGKILGDADSRAIAAYWPVLSDRIVGVLRQEKTRLLVTIDKLPFLVQHMIADHPDKGPAEVDQLLAALREWRNVGVKMVLAGSIGMAGLARKHGFRADHLNDLSSFDIAELTEAEARAFIAAAAGKGPAWSAAHSTALLREVGVFYPSFLVKALQTLPAAAAPQEFPDIFAQTIRPQLDDTFYVQFDRRFKFYAEIDKSLQRTLILPLLAAVLSHEGETAALPDVADYDAIDRREALAMLVEDGFIAYSEDAEGRRLWRPASRLARLWWRHAGL